MAVHFHLTNEFDLEVPHSVVPAFARACDATRAFHAAGGTDRFASDDDAINAGYSAAIDELVDEWSKLTTAFPTGIRLERSLVHHIAQP